MSEERCRPNFGCCIHTDTHTRLCSMCFKCDWRLMCVVFSSHHLLLHFSILDEFLGGRNQIIWFTFSPFRIIDALWNYGWCEWVNWMIVLVSFSSIPIRFPFTIAITRKIDGNWKSQTNSNWFLFFSRNAYLRYIQIPVNFHSFVCDRFGRFHAEQF